MLACSLVNRWGCAAASSQAPVLLALRLLPRPRSGPLANAASCPTTTTTTITAVTLENVICAHRSWLETSIAIALGS